MSSIIPKKFPCTNILIGLPWFRDISWEPTSLQSLKLFIKLLWPVPNNKAMERETWLQVNNPSEQVRNPRLPICSWNCRLFKTQVFMLTSTRTFSGPMSFCFIVHVSWPFNQICTVKSVFHCGFWGCFIMYLKCKFNTQNNTIKILKYFLQNITTKTKI